MKRFTYLLLLGGATLATSCSKTSDVAPIAPKEYQVEYRVSSVAAPAADYISYENETTGTTVLNNVALPASYAFKRTMKQGDHLNILASLKGGTSASEITASILLDGKEVAKQAGRGATAQAVPTYVIGQ